MVVLLLAPTVLSFLVFSAHLMRNGMVILVPFVLLALGLLWFRTPCVARFFQLALFVIAFLWGVQILLLASRRLADGEPWVRMSVILASVAIFALFAAALFETRALRRRYPRRAIF
jgi:hypothetical protein